MTRAGGTNRCSAGTRSSSDEGSSARVARCHLPKYRRHRPGRSVAFIGVINLVNTVRATYRPAISTTIGKTRSIHGVSQTPPRAKMLCMSIDKCTASVIGSVSVVTAITHSDDRQVHSIARLKTTRGSRISTGAQIHWLLLLAVREPAKAVTAHRSRP